MKGIHYVVDDRGERRAVVIDLGRYCELWEDFYDSVVTKERASEPRESLEEVKQRLGVAVSDYAITFARSARNELQAPLPSVTGEQLVRV